MENCFALFFLVYLFSILNICEGIKIHKPTKVYFTIGNAEGRTLQSDKPKAHLKNLKGLKDLKGLKILKKPNEIKKENKFLQFENIKKISINPMFPSLCKNVSVSETCLFNIHRFFSEVNEKRKNEEFNERKQFCGILYGTHEKEKKTVKIENVFFCMNSSEKSYDINYLFNSEERKKADKLAKLLNLEVVGFIYSYPDIGIYDTDKYNKSEKEIKNKKKNKNKKVNTMNDEDNEFFIPMGGKEVLLSLMLMQQIREQCEQGEIKECVNENKIEYADKTINVVANAIDNTMLKEGQRKEDKDKLQKEKTKKKEKKKEKQKISNSNIKPFITLSVGMNPNNESIVVEAYEMNYDLVKLLNYNLIKDIEKQNSILQFAKKPNEKEKKIKKFDSEIDIMNELYLKCKNNVFIKKIEIKKIDIIFCVNNVPIVSHKSTYNYFFPYPLHNYYNIFQKFNYMIKSIQKKKDIVPIFRDFNFLLFLTNFFSIDYDLPYFCNAVNDLTNSINIPEHYINVLKGLSSSTGIL